MMLRVMLRVSSAPGVTKGAIAEYPANQMSYQKIMKVKEVIPHTGPIPIVIPLKLFLDLLRVRYSHEG